MADKSESLHRRAEVNISRDNNGAAENVTPPCPIKEHLKNLLVPSSCEAGKMGCFGQYSGKEGTGLYCAAGEHILEKGLSGACEREKGGELFRVSLLLL